MAQGLAVLNVFFFNFEFTMKAVTFQMPFRLATQFTVVLVVHPWKNTHENKCLNRHSSQFAAQGGNSIYSQSHPGFIPKLFSIDSRNICT